MLPEPSHLPQVLTALRQKLHKLSKNFAIYGAGDVAIQAVNVLLLSVYVRYLTKADYGILALLGSIEAITKLFFRWGVDGAFMRMWYDCDDAPSRQRLSSTLFFFLLAVNGILLLLSLIAAPLVSGWLLESPDYTLALQLVLLNTFAIGFTFIPFHVLRIENRSREFSALAFARSAATLVLRVVLIVGFGFGVMGVVVADIVVTAVMLAVMVRWFAKLIRPMFSRAMLRDALAFGLPRVPHGFALQVMSVGDRLVMKFLQTPLEAIGVYSIGVSFGLIPKIALGAFEYAWAPFYYEASREAGASKVFSRVTTYGIAALALMTAGLSAIARDLLNLITHGQYGGAAGVVAWTAIGVFFYGVYLLTSIGLNITKNTRFYPASTAIGAAVNLGLNLWWIPRYGIIGAAWATGAAYAVQASIAFVLSQRYYPISYEHGRIARVLACATAAFLAAAMLPAMPPLAGVLARGATVAVTMVALLGVTRFFRSEELRALNAIRLRAVAVRPPVTVPSEPIEKAGEIIE
ncbi:MAG: polysaccharide biosynthesis C-terminal domain-containing protein [Vicinamibacterales bacterium]